MPETGQKMKISKNLVQYVVRIIFCHTWTKPRVSSAKIQGEDTIYVIFQKSHLKVQIFHTNPYISKTSSFIFKTGGGLIAKPILF